MSREVVTLGLGWLGVILQSQIVLAIHLDRECHCFFYDVA